MAVKQVSVHQRPCAGPPPGVSACDSLFNNDNNNNNGHDVHVYQYLRSTVRTVYTKHFMVSPVCECIYTFMIEQNLVNMCTFTVKSKG